MDDSKTRTLFLVALVSLALVVPYLLSPSQPATAKTAAAPTRPPRKEVPVARAEPLTAIVDTSPLPLQRLARIETGDFIAQVSNLNGGLTRFELKAARYHGRGKPVDIVTTSNAAYLPLAIELDGLPTDAHSSWSVQQLSARALLLSRDAGGLHVTRQIEAGHGPYQLWLTTRIENRSDGPRPIRLHVATHHYVTHEAEGNNVPLPVRSAQASHALCDHGGSLERKDQKALEEKSGSTKPEEYRDNVVFVGAENVYFLSALASDSGDVERCRLEASERGHAPPKTWSWPWSDSSKAEALGSLFSARLTHKQVVLAPGATQTYRTLAYLGPKSPAELDAAGHSFKETIQSGWFTTLAEGLTWLLRRIHDGVGNWGLAIILLTFFVKAVLFPLTAKQMQSMAKMKELKPELDRIGELYGDDREKKGAAIMELYRKRGVNPMAGCFPVLLQLPIWFSLYASLSSNVELFRAPFALWWHDLSAPDPLFVLPLALGLLMFVQQKMSPATGVDPVQQKMMLYMMPTMITSFMLFLPAGLCLYMFTNSALSIGQQRLIEARLKAASANAATQLANSPPGKQAPPSQQTEVSTITTSSPAEQQSGGRPNKNERRWRRGKR